MLVVGYITVPRRWKDKKAEYKTEHPLPDPEQLNAAIPVAEWEIGLDGKPREPWKLTYVIYMVDAFKTGALYTYAHDTYGAMLAYNNLEEQIAVMRMLRGEHVFPIVHLERRPMKTTHGMKTRPHLQVMDWRAPGSVPVVPQSPTPQLSGPATAAAPAAAAASAPAPAAAPTATPAAAAAPAAPPTAPATVPPAASPTTASTSAVLDNTKPVKPVTVAELIADELPPWA